MSQEVAALARLAAVGQKCIDPDWMASIVQNAEKIAPALRVHPVELVVFMTAGVMWTRAHKAAGGAPPEELPDQARIMLEAMMPPAEEKEPEPTGPVKDRQDMRDRAAKAGIILA